MVAVGLRHRLFQLAIWYASDRRMSLYRRTRSTISLVSTALAVSSRVKEERYRVRIQDAHAPPGGRLHLSEIDGLGRRSWHRSGRVRRPGRVARVPSVRLDRDRVLPDVLDVYFRDPMIWPSLKGDSPGTNVRRRRLNPSIFLSLKIPLPSMPDQRSLAAVRAKLSEAAKSTENGRISWAFQADQQTERLSA